jgi:hypothetical protein
MPANQLLLLPDLIEKSTSLEWRGSTVVATAENQERLEIERALERQLPGVRVGDRFWGRIGPVRAPIYKERLRCRHRS